MLIWTNELGERWQAVLKPTSSLGDASEGIMYDEHDLWVSLHVSFSVQE